MEQQILIDSTPQKQPSNKPTFIVGDVEAVNPGALSCLIAYACLRNLGFGGDDLGDEDLAQAIAAAVSVSAAVRANAGRRSGKTANAKPRKPGTTELPEEGAYEDWELVPFSGFQLRVTEGPNGKHMVKGWGKRAVTAAEFERNKIKFGRQWDACLAHALEIVKGREEIDIFETKGAYILARNASRRAGGIKLEKFLQYNGSK